MWFTPKLSIYLKNRAVHFINFIIIAITTLYCQFSVAASVSTAVLEELSLYGKAEVLIVLHEPAAIESTDRLRLAHVAAQQQSVLETLPSDSFKLRHRYRYIPGLAATITEEALTRLQNHTEVKSIGLDEADFLALAESNQVIGADVLHSLTPLSYTGKNVVVAVLDTGIETTHPDLVGDIIAEHCITHSRCPPGNTITSNSAEGDHYHGTHVSGIITSNNAISTSVGVAPDAKIVAVKTCDFNGACYASDVIAGLDWLRGRLSVLPVKVVNLSLGGKASANICDSESEANELYEQAIKQLKMQKVITFAASGNEGLSGQIYRPACLSSAFAVGATYDDDVGYRYWGSANCADPSTTKDQIACFSNSNAHVDILAPGAMIVSSDLGATTKEDGGTSMATPMAAGVAALMLEANPGLTPDEILHVMQETGIALTDSRNNLTFKRVNAYDAVLAVRPGQLQFASSTHSFNEDDGQVTIEVSRVAGSYGSVSVDYQITDDTTLYGEDYQATQTGTLTWNAGETTKTIVLNIEDDQIYEGVDEYLSITLYNPVPNYVRIETPEKVTISIIDNESPLAGAFQFDQSEYLVEESSGELTVTINRILGLDGEVSVSYQTLAHTATADDDYTAVSGLLTWADGDEADKQLTIPILDNDQFEDPERFTLVLTDPINAALGPQYFATVLIEDDDPQPPPPIEEPLETPTAIYVPPLKFTVSVKIAGSGTGSVISEPVGIHCNNRPVSSCTHHRSDFVFHCLPSTHLDEDTCSAEFKRQTEVTLTPKPDADSVFIGWGGALDCADGRFTVLSDKYCVAYMSALHTLTIIPSKAGQVNSYNDARQPTGIECALATRAHCAHRFYNGQIVVLEAHPQPGAQFIGWSGDCKGSQQTILVPMLNSKTCQAQFAPLK